MADEKYTDEELALLSEEERAALLDDDDDGGEADDDADAGGDGKGDQGKEDDPDAGGDDDKGGDGGEDGAGAEGEEEAGEGEEDGGSDDGGADDDDAGADDGAGKDDGDDAGGADDDGRADTGAADREPPFVAHLPDDYEDQVKAVKDEKAKLISDFDDGEINAREYHERLDALNEKDLDLRLMKRDAENAAQMAQQQVVNDWKRTVSTFLAQNPRYAPPKDEGESNPLYSALDAEVRRLAKSKAGEGLSDAEILHKAHETVEAAFSPGGQGGGEQDGKGKSDGKAGDRRRRKPVDAPPNLAKAPAAAAEDVHDSRWSKLDRLQERDGEAFEAEFAKLTEAQQEEYLSRG